MRFVSDIRMLLYMQQEVLLCEQDYTGEGLPGFMLRLKLTFSFMV
jgi:hypothetical protein